MTSDQYLHQIAIDKNKLNSQFLNLIKKTAIDCSYNLDVNRKGDPVISDPNFKCRTTDDFTKIFVNDSSDNFISVPDQTYSILKTSKQKKIIKILSITTPSSDNGVFNIAVLFDGEYLYDLYRKYGLNPSDKENILDYYIIGNVSKVNRKIEIRLYKEFLDDTDKLLTYQLIDKARLEIESENPHFFKTNTIPEFLDFPINNERNPNYIGIPEVQYINIWRSRIKKKYLEIQKSFYDIESISTSTESKEESISTKDSEPKETNKIDELCDKLGIDIGTTSDMKVFNKWRAGIKKTDPVFFTGNEQNIKELANLIRNQK
jgi:hypothetical protein